MVFLLFFSCGSFPGSAAAGQFPAVALLPTDWNEMGGAAGSQIQAPLLQGACLASWGISVLVVKTFHLQQLCYADFSVRECLA